jgi:hypothetical protein
MPTIQKRSLRRILTVGAAACALFGTVSVRAEDQSLSAETFKNPTQATRPQTLYFWMNGNVTREGLDSDLDAMKQAGLGGVLVFDGSDDIPKGPVDYLSPQWLDLMTHMMAKSKALGLKVGMHNAPGWSSSGGPWITPAQAMQQIVWTETTVGGGKMVKLKLPQPYTKESYYKDAAIIAFPASAGDESAYTTQIKAMSVNGAAVKPAQLTDRDLHTTFDIAPDAPLVIEMKAAFPAQAITLYAAKEQSPFFAALEASDDGHGWRAVGKISVSVERGVEAPGSLNFATTSARFFRLTPSTKAHLAEALIYATPRISDWDIKGEQNFRMLPAVETRVTDKLAQYAIDPKQVIDLTAMTDAEGNLNWKAPRGQWTILRFGHTPTGKLNVAASDSGRGLEVDKLDAAAVDHQFESSVARVIKAAGPLTGDSFDMLEIDSYEAGLQNWTPLLPQAFKTHAGYDITAYLPALTGRIVGDAETSDRFLYDYRRTVADLMATNYYGNMQAHAKKAGLRFHMEGYGPGPFDELQVSGSVEVPMTEFWTRTPWTDNRSVKMVTSAAHVYGKKVIAAEAFTGEAQTSRWMDYPYALKPLGDLMFTQGVNSLYFHRYAHQPNPKAVVGMTMGPWGINLDRSNTWMMKSKPWMDYLARSQYLLRQGDTVADVLFMVSEESPNQAEYTRPDVNPDSNPMIGQYLKPQMPAGYQYDLVNADVLLTRAKVENGRIVMPDSASYRMLVLPDTLKSLTPQLAEKLKDLVSQGMVILGPKPDYSLTLGNREASETAFKAATDALWGAGIAVNTLGAGKVYPSGDIKTVLDDLGVQEDVRCKTISPDGQIGWVHHKVGDDDVYFVANRQRREETAVCDFRVTGKTPEFWNPETGAITQPAVYSQRGGRTQVEFKFTPAESLFVRFKPAVAQAVAWVEKDGQRVASSELPMIKRKAAPSNTFTLSVWAKPDIDLRAMPKETATGRINETGKNYLVNARSGADLYGDNASVAGLSIGRNGAFVLERVSAKEAPAVLVSHQPVAGWTHFALVYADGVPSLYINGKLAKTGQKTGHTVYAGGSDAPSANGVTYFFEGEAMPLETFDRALSAGEIAGMAAKGLPTPSLATPAVELTRTDQGLQAQIWQSGAYTTNTGAAFKAQVSVPVTIDGPWQVAFEADRGAPATITLPKLESLSHNADDGVKHFAGTATYTRRINVPKNAFKAGERVYLDLGRVEVLASVTVNGHDLGTVWKPPYRVDITDAVKAGDNTVSVAVTSLWPNRMIADAALPQPYDYVDAEWAIGENQGADGKMTPVMARKITKLPDWYTHGEAQPKSDRVTFSTWTFFQKDEPLLDSGLLGPVRLVFSETRTIK